MPLYPAHCPNCEYVEVLSPSPQQGSEIDCDECGATARRYVTTCAQIGPSGDRPLKLHDGTVFESAGELRAYEKANPGSRIASPSDSAVRSMKDRAFEKRETIAKDLGFRTFHQMNDYRRKDIAARGTSHAQ
jgi:hypothetical protein